MVVRQGVLLGMINIVAIAVVMGLVAGDRTIDFLRHDLLFVPFGGIPAAIAGAMIGLLAARTQTYTPRLRVTLLGAPAVAIVFAATAAFHMADLAPAACVPTFVAVLVLERWTRQAPQLPRIPTATMRPARL